MYDFNLLIILLPFFGLSWYVSNKLKSKFIKYSKIKLSKDFSGREVAEIMLRDHGIENVKVHSVPGKLSDHYNPINKTINLSPEVYNGRSVSSTAVAAHECGHAVQHAQGYAFLQLRSALVPLQNVSSKVLQTIFIFILLGAFGLPNILPMSSAILIVVICYSAFTAFAFITLPVEFDASKKAVAWIVNRNIVNNEESIMAKDALHWAAMTYVVVALQSLVTLVYYLSIFFRRR